MDERDDYAELDIPPPREWHPLAEAAFAFAVAVVCFALIAALIFVGQSVRQYSPV
jgi:hypothetical protein